MHVLHDMPIRRKLTLIIMASSVIVLLLSSLAFIVNDAVTFWKAEKGKLSVVADIIGNNTSAAIAFSDQKAAEQTLSGLSANPHILSAYILTREGKVFAHYVGKDADVNSPGQGLKPHTDLMREAKYSFFMDRDSDLEVVKPILLDGQMMGTVVIQSNFGELTTRLKTLFFVVALILAGTILVAFVLSSKLQHIISGPLLHLTQTMKAVSEQRDYSIREKKESNDELGILVDGFNEMLTQIEDRDKENIIKAEIGRIISSTLDIGQVYKPFATTVSRLIQFDRISISIIDSEHRNVRVAYAMGTDIPERRPGNVFPLAGSHYEDLIRARSSLFIQTDDVHEVEERYPSFLPTFQAGLRSLISVPLISKDQVIGGLHLRSLKSYAYTERDLKIAESIGIQIAGAVANAQLFIERQQAEEELKESEERAKRLSRENAIMAEIGRIVSSTLNIDDVYERFAEKVRELIPFDRITINIINTKENTIRNAYVAGIDVPGHFKDDTFPLPGGITEEVMHTRTSMISQEVMKQTADQFPPLLPLYQAGIRSLMAIPIIIKDEVIGVLLIQSAKPNAYSEQDLGIADRVSRQIAGAIASAELFIERRRAEEQLRQSEEREKQLSRENAIVAEIGRIISSTLNIDEVYEPFAEKVHELIPFDRISINIFNPRENAIRTAYVTGIDVAERLKGDAISMVGTLTEKVIGNRTKIIIQGEDQKKVIDQLPGLLPHFQAGLQSLLAIPMITKDEVIGALHFQSHKSNAYSERDLSLAERVGNQIAGAIASAQLFQERQQVEAALRESEEKYRTILENIEDGYYEVDLAGNLTFFNDSLCRIWGYPQEELMGMNDRQFTDQENAKRLFQAFNKVYRTGEPGKECDWEIIRKDGTKRYVEASISLRKDSLGNPIGFRGIVRDITERKRAEETLKEKTEELARSNKDLEQFAYVASHDLQEPLRMVTNYVQLLARRYQGKLDSDADEFIGFAVDGAIRMWKLINDLLTYSRVGMRGRELEPTNCETVLEQSLNNLKMTVAEKGAVVTHAPLPTVMADHPQLEQLFQNLIGNAIKFQGNEPPRIHVSASRNGSGWTFSVRDNGIGIAPEYAERIFVIFQRLHHRKEYPGTGIGLAICKKIVERHGGHIWVESDVGKGATFCFTLPASKGELFSQGVSKEGSELWKSS